MTKYIKKSDVCSVCFSTGPTEVHHIIPVSLGGPDSLSNLIELCLDCHAKAHYHRKIWRQRALEGIQKRKNLGLYVGSKPTISRKVFKSLLEKGLSCEDISKTMRIGRASAFRIKKEIKNG